MAKPKKILTTEHDNLATRLVDALNVKFPVFKFSVAPPTDGPSRADVMAEGPWDLPANQRPAMGTMTSFAEGYLGCLIDSQ